MHYLVRRGLEDMPSLPFTFLAAFNPPQPDI